MAFLPSNQAVHGLGSNIVGGALGASLAIVGGAVGGGVVGAVRSHWSKDSTWYSMKRDAAFGAVGAGIGVAAHYGGLAVASRLGR